MSFLSIMKAVAKNAGVVAPQSVSGSDDAVLFSQFINEAGQEIARRVDWSALRKTATLTGDGTPAPHAIGTDFDRLTRGLNVIHDGNPVRGGLTQDEWLSLPTTQGPPRFYYLANREMAFWPYLAISDTATVQYQSQNWVAGDKAAMEANEDASLVPDDLVAAFAIVKWRRHVGKDFSDNLAEAEAMLADRAQFDGGVRLP